MTYYTEKLLSLEHSFLKLPIIKQNYFNYQDIYSYVNY